MQQAHMFLSDDLATEDTRAPQYMYTDVLVQSFHKLHDWRQCYQRRVSSGPFSWSVLSRLENPADDAYPDKLFPFSLGFRSITDAVTWVFCSTIMLQILETILRLDASGALLPTILLAADSTRCEHMVTPIRVYADDLARSYAKVSSFALVSKTVPSGLKAPVLRSGHCGTTFGVAGCIESSSGARISRT